MPQNKILTQIDLADGGIGGSYGVNFATKIGIDRTAGSSLPAVGQKN
jgi:hypothetical protein